MGNDQSHFSGIEIGQKSVEVSDFWSHHTATIINTESTTTLSVLIGELFVEGPLWKAHTPLEKCSKHLMIYRHPCILRYISSWNKSSKFYLAVEEVAPLSHVLGGQNALQICIGLHSILKALCFLHEKAGVSHNNISTASIYATKEGGWKLGGMEYLCKFTDLTEDYLKKAKNNRYSKAVDPNETKLIQGGKRKDFVDVYAFGVLVGEVLKNKTDDEIPSLSSFREFCKSELLNIDVFLRPKLSTLLQHEFFNHEFIFIHSFLTELPLKSDENKTQFFHTLIERLRAFPEVIVASQLGNLLLSRLVLLNKTAQEDVLPYILSPQDTNSGSLFGEDTFKTYLAPKTLKIFAVRDSQIRLLLLNYFKHFVNAFSKEELQSCILPELLVGIKDTDDYLVAMTLRTLSDLVPILGAVTVIGGKRAKLFNDGRPTTTAIPRRSQRKSLKRIELLLPPVLPERPRPDGEEGETSAEEAEPSVEEDLDNWEDWGETALPSTEDLHESSSIHSSESVASVIDNQEISAPTLRKKSLPDITELDIKNQTGSGTGEDFDFFQDMEPVIESASKFLIEEKKEMDLISHKLHLEMPGEDAGGDGWVDEEWE